MRSSSFEQYEKLSAAATARSSGVPGAVPVFREIPADLLTPVSAFLSFAKGARHAFLLESVVGGERLARYSFLGRDPEATVETKGSGVLVRDAHGERTEAKSLFTAIRERLEPKAVEVPGLPRLTGGAVGYLSY
ncbi:MAG TPA: anthranilate synthase component I, partial [Vicinamibacteria bacterium]